MCVCVRERVVSKARCRCVRERERERERESSEHLEVEGEGVAAREVLSALSRVCVSGFRFGLKTIGLPESGRARMLSQVSSSTKPSFPRWCCVIKPRSAVERTWHI